MRKKYFKNTQAFTLIELLVVIAIIGLLSSVVLASLSGARESARDTQRAQDFRQFRTAVNMYYNDTGEYPGAGDNSGARIGSGCDTTDLYIDLVEGGYMPDMITDPANSMSTCDGQELKVGSDEEYFYSWDSNNADGDFCFGMQEFESSDDAGALENINQEDDRSVGNDGNLGYADFLYCFEDAGYI